MKINAHLHVNYQGLTHDTIITYLDKHHFDLCWLLTWEEINPGKWYYSHLSVEDVLHVYETYPSRVIPMYAPDPNNMDAPSLLKNAYDKGIKGCAELKVTLNWQSDAIKKLLSVVSELNIPVLFHMEESYHWTHPLEQDNAFDNFFLKILKWKGLSGLPNQFINRMIDNWTPLYRWVQKRTAFFPGYLLDFSALGIILDLYPTINFIGHGPLFWKHISKHDEPSSAYPKGHISEKGLLCYFLDHYPNLYADISAYSGFNALQRDIHFSKQFVHDYSHKLIFGTDNTHYGHENLLKSLKLSSEILNQIFWENAYKLLK